MTPPHPPPPVDPGAGLSGSYASQPGAVQGHAAALRLNCDECAKKLTKGNEMGIYDVNISPRCLPGFLNKHKQREA